MDGTTHQLRIEDDGTTLKITVSLAGLQTGIGLRDRHMREKYLQVDGSRTRSSRCPGPA